MNERRYTPRANVAIALRTGSEPADVIRTVNLSSGGVAFESPRWMEPFTKLEMMFVFPTTGTESGDDERIVRVEAVVMRTEPEDPADDVDRYRIACCFTGMRAADREFVAEYVEGVIAAEERRAAGNESPA